MPYGGFLREVEGSHQGIYSVVFTGLAAPAIGLVGLAGTLLLPLLGGLLTLFGTKRIVDSLGGEWWLSLLAALVVGLLTPLLFYSGQFAEHSLATGLLIVALSLLLEGGPARSAAAGVLAALAATVRPEAYCGVVSLGLVALIAAGNLKARTLRSVGFGLAGGLVIGAYWLVNLKLSGHWDPLVAHNSEDAEFWKTARTMLLGELSDSRRLYWLAPFVTAALFSLLPPALGRSALGLAARAAVTAWIAYLCWKALELSTARVFVGMFSVTAIAAYGLWAGPWRPKAGLVWIFAVSFTLQVLLLDSSGTAGGLQFGARLLLPALPVFVALAVWLAYEQWRDLRPIWARLATLAPPAALLVVTGWAMIKGLPEANEIAENGLSAAETAASAPGEVVVTRRWWESQVLSPVLLQGKPLYNKHGDPRPIFEALAEAGVSDVTFISRGETDLRLRGGRRVRTITAIPGWLEVQHVRIEPAEE